MTTETEAKAPLRRWLMVAEVSPMSVLKVTLALSLVAFVAWLIAVAVLYVACEVAGVWDSLNALIGGIGGDGIGFGLVMSLAVLMGAVMVVINTLLAPVLALVYNAVVHFVGGVEYSAE
ncbi:DUF3566 domain-containing protein [Corynebacterium uterequi]|uniref:DUF3566 domain-containing protein n=1 Tax=Corynebacterium uterequi TaxID=1072256 RepID=A0A0G3HDL4_9CORY|nr:DUF3566 domain-containing protein [Corynebacterium uterequi]AKK10058.1 Transmembrane domain of unknown function (DUF3566) [Corynebacterium uterequi]